MVDAVAATVEVDVAGLVVVAAVSVVVAAGNSP